MRRPPVPDARTGSRVFSAAGARDETVTVTPMPLRFKIGARTDQGRVRKNNQDSIFTGTMPMAASCSAA